MTTQEKHDFIAKHWGTMSLEELCQHTGYTLNSLRTVASYLRQEGFDLPRKRRAEKPRPKPIPQADPEDKDADEPYVTPFENGLGVRCVDPQRNAYAIIRDKGGPWGAVGHLFVKHEHLRELEEIVRKLPPHIFV